MEESAHVDADAPHLPPAARARATRTSAPSCSRTSTAARTTSRALLPLAPNLRLVKGAYLEPPEIAYPHKGDVDAAYVRLFETSLAGGRLHRDRDARRGADRARDRVRERAGIARERFQFQMLYGVRAALQLDLVGRGYDVLVATPYGPEWYRYLMRRLAERPANVLFLLRNLVRG